MTLAHEGTKAYQNKYDLMHRREATRPNEIWQADHTELDIWVIHEKGNLAPGPRHAPKGSPRPETA